MSRTFEGCDLGGSRMDDETRHIDGSVYDSNGKTGQSNKRSSGGVE